MSTNVHWYVAILAFVASPLFADAAFAADWPMYRYDSQRSAATSHQLADDLHLQWTVRLAEPRRAWPWQQDDFEKLAFDASYEPVVVGDTLFVGSMVTDSVTAYDIDSGRQRWRYQADGPVRLAPLVWQDRVYAASDDGALHCLDAASGRRIWRFQAAPTNRLVLGNDRLISMWPVRGGPVIAEGTLYFAAGIWPHEGVFLYAVDAETGEVQWVNSGSSSDIVEDSKGYFSFGGVAPQGQLVVADDRLIVPGGRTTPAVFDRHTGELLYYHVAGRATGKAAGGHQVVVQGDWFFNRRDRYVTDMYHVSDGAQYGSVHVDVVTPEMLLGVEAGEGRVHAYGARIRPTDEHRPPEIATGGPGRPIFDSPRDAMGRSTTIRGRLRRGTIRDYYDLQSLWTVDVPGIEQLHVRAGSVIYGSGEDGRIFALEIGDTDQPAELKWTRQVEGPVFSMIAARERLFVITESGALHCFGPQARDAVVHEEAVEPLEPTGDAWSERAARMLDQTDLRGGYALMFGAGCGRLLDELLAQSDLHMTVFEPEAERVAELRQRYTQDGRYGSRVAVHRGDATSHRLPPYVASLIVAAAPSAAETGEAAWVQALFHPLRPYGGNLFVLLDDDRQEAFAAAVTAADLENAERESGSGYAVVRRPGPLPGSDSWTHQNADAANSGYSADRRVKAPLGIAWFGGAPNHKTLPRHLHGPITQVVGGRLILLGPHHVSARCVYTGVQLWAAELPEVGDYFTSWEHEEEMARGDRTVYFPNHPGANFIGAPLASATDSVYVIHNDRCLRLDAASGEQLAVFDMPDREELQQQIRDPFTQRMMQSYGARLQEGEQLRWGNIRYEGDYLIAAAYQHMFDERQPGRENNWNATSSEFLVVMDRRDGEIRWVQQARYGFRHNAIAAGGDTVFVIDNLSEEVRGILDRRGIDPDIEPQIAALDLDTGSVLWACGEDVFGTSLSYSQVHDVLVQSGHPGRRRALPDEPRDRLHVRRGENGELLWAESFRQRRSPIGLHDTRRQILGSTGEGAADMFDGTRPLGQNPLTGEEQEWNWIGALRCGTQTFSEHLALFRSGAGGFADLRGRTTGNISGVRPGCTNNLVAADGLVNSPDYSRTCSCSYQQQTSLGLVHMPDVEMWTFNPLPDPEAGTIRRVGINFGAPASRLDDSLDTLWLEYPQLVRPAPRVPVQVTSDGDPVWFHQHSSVIQESPEGRHWVAASGVQGVRSVRVAGLVTEGSNPGPPVYRVRLHFAEPQPLAPGERRFDVAVQGQRVLDDLDVRDRAGGHHRTVVVDFDVSPDDEGAIEIVLEPAAGSEHETLLCGVELQMVED